MTISPYWIRRKARRGWRAAGGLGLALLCCLSLLLTGCRRTRMSVPTGLPAAAAVKTPAVIPDDYLLRAGDQVFLDVFREPDLSGPFRLESSGDIRHPLFGSVQIAGLSPSDAETRITQLLAERYLVDPRVMIRVTSSQSHQLVILGEVKKPGVLPMPFDEPMTLMQAVAEAGGFTDLASVNRVKIVRSGEDRQRKIRVRVSRIIDGREPDIQLEPNDIVTIPQSFF